MHGGVTAGVELFGLWWSSWYWWLRGWGWEKVGDVSASVWLPGYDEGTHRARRGTGTGQNAS